jgi:hypothetical protein
MFFRSHILKNLVALSVLAFLVALQPLPSHASTWQKLKPATSPPARSYAAMAYDPVSQKVVLFGGYGSTDLNDTWTFDGTTWSHVKTKVKPPVRAAATMAFDKRANKLVLFGGFAYATQQYLQDTWAWDGGTSTWSRVKMTKSPPSGSGAMLFTDPNTGRAMMFGGYNANHQIPAYNVTWRFTGTGWQKLHPATTPIPRGWGVTCLDSKRNNVVMTGGSARTIRTDNTWTWNGTNWTQQSPANQVQSMIGPAYAFDPALQAVVVFGGNGTQTGDTNQTWEWTGSDWAQLSPAKLPPAREGAGMAYDSASKQAVMFGGQLSDKTALNDTWVLVGR